MESESYSRVLIVKHTLQQIQSGITLLKEWNCNINCVNDYTTSTGGLQTMAASCMMLESFGEACKKIDKLLPEFLTKQAPDYNWKELKGLRDVIAHGYFKIDADVIFSIISTELDILESTITQLIDVVEDEI